MFSWWAQTLTTSAINNWFGSLCSMEADIVIEGFWDYAWFIVDGDNSVYHAVSQGVLSYVV